MELLTGLATVGLALAADANEAPRRRVSHLVVPLLSFGNWWPVGMWRIDRPLLERLLVITEEARRTGLTTETNNLFGLEFLMDEGLHGMLEKRWRGTTEWKDALSLATKIPQYRLIGILELEPDTIDPWQPLGSIYEGAADLLYKKYARPLNEVAVEKGFVSPYGTPLLGKWVSVISPEHGLEFRIKLFDESLHELEVDPQGHTAIDMQWTPEVLRETLQLFT
jgi:hypothetical protein